MRSRCGRAANAMDPLGTLPFRIPLVDVQAPVASLLWGQNSPATVPIKPPEPLRVAMCNCCQKPHIPPAYFLLDPKWMSQTPPSGTKPMWHLCQNYSFSRQQPLTRTRCITAANVPGMLGASCWTPKWLQQARAVARACPQLAPLASLSRRHPLRDLTQAARPNEVLA